MAYPSVTELKAWLGVVGASEDTNLGTALDASIAAVERYCKRKFEPVTETNGFPVMYPYVDDRRLILTPMRDFENVTAVTNGDGVAISSSNYRLEPYNAPYVQIILFPESGVRFKSVDQGYVEVSADWGMTRPDDVTYAMLELAAYFFRRRQSGGAQRFVTARERGTVAEAATIPAAIRSILDQYRRYSV